MTDTSCIEAKLRDSNLLIHFKVWCTVQLALHIGGGGLGPASCRRRGRLRAAEECARVAGHVGTWWQLALPLLPCLCDAVERGTCSGTLRVRVRHPP